MRRLMSVMSGLMLAAGLVLVCAPPAGAQTALEGSWNATRAERDGKAADDVVGHRLAFAGKRFEIRSNDGKTLYAGTFRTDPRAKPAAIDFANTRGAAKGRAWQGIYTLEGDTLTICDNAPIRASAGRQHSRPSASPATSWSHSRARDSRDLPPTPERPCRDIDPMFAPGDGPRGSLVRRRCILSPRKPPKRARKSRSVRGPPLSAKLGGLVGWASGIRTRDCIMMLSVTAVRPGISPNGPVEILPVVSEVTIPRAAARDQASIPLAFEPRARMLTFTTIAGALRVHQNQNKRLIEEET